MPNKKPKGQIHSQYSKIESEIPALTRYNDLHYYKKMSSDDVISSALESIRLPINEAEYSIKEPNEANPKEKKIAEFIKFTLLENFDFRRFIKSSSKSILTYGFKVFGIGLKTITKDRRRYWGIDQLVPLPSPTIKEDVFGSRSTDGRIKYLIQDIDGKNTKIKRDELLIITANSESEADWRGESPLKPVFPLWVRKDKYYNLQGLTLQKHGPGINVFTLPGSEENEFGNNMEADEAVTESAKQYNEMKKSSLEQLSKVAQGKSSSITIPAGSKLEILERRGNNPDILLSIKRVEENIIKALLVPHINLGDQGNSGSQAASVNLSHFYIQIVTSRARDIVDGVNSDLVKLLVDLNYGKQDRYPKLVVNNLFDNDSKDFFMLMQYLTSISEYPEVKQLGIQKLGLQLSLDEIKKRDEEKMEKMKEQMTSQNQNNEEEVKKEEVKEEEENQE